MQDNVKQNLSLEINTISEPTQLLKCSNVIGYDILESLLQ
jgi:hypothetical protein